MKRNSRLIFVLISGLLIVINLFVWVPSHIVPPNSLLSVSFLDVGQGDAIFITSPSGNQMLIDGGPDGSVLRQISKEMKIFDRSIDVVLATHPDRDHINGLADVLNRYRVSHYVHSGVESDSSLDEALMEVVRIHDIPEVIARRNMEIDLGGGVLAKVLFPDRDPRGMDTNDASIVLKLTYGNTCFVLSGDAPQTIERYVIGLEKENLKCQVLKAGHHGSKTSTSQEFLYFVKPEIVIFSAGKDNTYGHPHQEVTDRVKNSGAQIFSTAESGTIQIQSDGVKVWSK